MMIRDLDRLNTVPEGPDQVPTMLSFSESPELLHSAAFRPRFGGTLRAPSSKSCTATVAHRPWEDSFPSQPRWTSGKAKTFKPVLLYHRPEEPDLPYHPRPAAAYSHHIPSHDFEDDAGECCFHHCHEDVEDGMRELIHSAIIQDHLWRMGYCVYSTGRKDSLERNCSCGLHSPLDPWIRPVSTVMPLHAFSLQRPERDVYSCRRSCQGPCSNPGNSLPYACPVSPLLPLFPQSPLAGSPLQLTFPATHRTQGQLVTHGTRDHPTLHSSIEAAGHPAVASMSVPPQHHFSAAPRTSTPYFPLFGSHLEKRDNGSASEIRRALLTNHPVFSDNSTTTSSNRKGAGFRDNQGKCSTVFGENRSGVHVGGIPSEKYPSLQLGGTRAPKTCFFNVSSGISVAAGSLLPSSECSRPGSAFSAITHISPVSSVSSDAGTEGWQEWAGRYGSFLQFLNSPDSPCSVTTTPTVPLTSCSSRPTEPAAKQFASNGPAVPRAPGGLGDIGEQTMTTAAGAQDHAEDSAEDRDSRRHKCHFCHVSCTNNGQLKGHLRVHTGERPYKCHCGRAFARNEELTRHRRIHSGLRPHLCLICGKGFGRKDHLNKHQKTHLCTSEKKIHACHVLDCQQRYTRSDALARHQWGAHGIKAKTSRIRPELQPQPLGPITNMPHEQLPSGTPTQPDSC